MTSNLASCLCQSGFDSPPGNKHTSSSKDNDTCFPFEQTSLSANSEASQNLAKKRLLLQSFHPCCSGFIGKRMCQVKKKHQQCISKNNCKRNVLVYLGSEHATVSESFQLNTALSLSFNVLSQTAPCTAILHRHFLICIDTYPLAPSLNTHTHTSTHTHKHIHTQIYTKTQRHIYIHKYTLVHIHTLSGNSE